MLTIAFGIVLGFILIAMLPVLIPIALILFVIGAGLLSCALVYQIGGLVGLCLWLIGFFFAWLYNS
jgi:hypothetical protein